jgi:hypothetical protein
VDTDTRRRWPRYTLVLSPEQSAALAELARTNYRDPKREALRLLTEGLERESRRDATR